MIGGFSRHPHLQHIFSTTSTLYFEDDATWCVQAALREPSWKNIFFTFTPQLWIAIFTIFLVVSFIIHFYLICNERKCDLSWTIVHTLKICIGSAHDFKPKKFYVRFILFIFLLYGFIISASFHSATVRSITGEYYDNQIDSLEEMVKSKFHFVGSSFSLNNIVGRMDEVKFLFPAIKYFN